MSNQKKRYGAGGYYIALALCAAAIGVSGYLYYRSAGETELDAPAAVTQEAQTQKPTAAARPDAVPQNTVPPQTEAAPKGPMKTASPVEGELVAAYSVEALSYNETTRDWRTHAGMDIAAAAGTEVKAAADGEVYTVYEDETMGTTVVIRHEGGYTTHYSSLSQEVKVAPGDKVSLGDVIGTVGTTALLESVLGDHVCFRVTLDGDTVDPLEFLS